MIAAIKPMILRGILYACVKRQCVCGWRREVEAAEEDGTLLMLMRELSVPVINIGGLTAKQWSFGAFIYCRFHLIAGSNEGQGDSVISGDKLRRKRSGSSFVSRPGLVLVTDTGGLPLEKKKKGAIEMKTYNLGLSQRRHFPHVSLKAVGH